MSIVTAISTGAVAFSATNIDDLVILTLFFSQVDAKFRRWHAYYYWSISRFYSLDFN